MTATTFDDPGDILRELDFKAQCETFAGDGKHRCKNHAWRHAIFVPERPAKTMIGRLVCRPCLQRLADTGQLQFAGGFV